MARRTRDSRRGSAAPTCPRAARLLAVLLLWLGAGTASAAARHASTWHASVSRSVAAAAELLGQRPRAPLLVPMLSSRGHNLCCMLPNFFGAVGSRVAGGVDVFVFSRAAGPDEGGGAASHDERVLLQACPQVLKAHAGRLFFLPLREHWHRPPAGSAAGQEELWSAPRYGAQYRQMGHWRLVFQMAFADRLGYKFVLQVDDDSKFTQPLGFDLAQRAAHSRWWLAGFRRGPDTPAVTWGLPELARLFLVAERQEPAGPLFTNFTQPPGLDGLFTTRAPGGAAERLFRLNATAGGWTRDVLAGNCLLIDVGWWFRADVQRFVDLVVASGLHYRFRWNEQSTIAMMWHLFVPWERLGDFGSGSGTLRGYEHGHALKRWTC